MIETFESRTERDVAEVAYKQADKLLKALDSELRAWQSIGASVRQQYAVAGRGEDRKSTRLNSSHHQVSRMPSSA